MYTLLGRPCASSPANELLRFALPRFRSLRQATSNILDVWEGTREALGSLSVDTTLAYSLERRVAALEGVRASDQDICQVSVKTNKFVRTVSVRKYAGITQVSRMIHVF